MSILITTAEVGLALIGTKGVDKAVKGIKGAEAAGAAADLAKALPDQSAKVIGAKEVNVYSSYSASPTAATVKTSTVMPTGGVASATKGAGSKAVVDSRKFIFKDGAAPGKDVVYKNLGYSAKDSELLTKVYREQAAAKYASGNYTNRMVVDGATIENVIFDEADGTGMLHYSSNFKNCRFSKANLKNLGFGIDGTRYHNTLFNNANFKGTTFHNGTFTDCTFSDCKLDGVDFDSSHFINVKFTGKLDDVWFRGENPDKEELQEERVKGHGLNPMLVDFSEAELVDVVFSDNCDLTKAILPNDGNHILIMN